MTTLSGLQRMACGHPDLTPEDGKGYAICGRCGSVITVRLTAEIFNKDMAAIKKARP